MLDLKAFGLGALAAAPVIPDPNYITRLIIAALISFGTQVSIKIVSNWIDKHKKPPGTGIS